MRKNLKFAGVCAACAAVLAAVLVIIFVKINSKAPVAAFYQIDEQTQNTILATLNNGRTQKKQKEYTALSLNDDAPLSAQTDKLKKAGILFTRLDYDVLSFCKDSSEVQKLSANLLDGMPVSINSSVFQQNGTASYIPLLYDFYQIDVNYQDFSKWAANGNPLGITNFDDYMNFLKYVSRQKDSAVVFEGTNQNFLAILGMIAEAVYPDQNSAPDKYELVCKKLYDAFLKDSANDVQNENARKFENIEEVLWDECGPDGFLYSAISALKKLIAERSLNLQSVNFSERDMLFYLENSLSDSAMLTLSSHRKIDHKVINNYTSIYCPSLDAERGYRTFMAPCICAVGLKNARKTALEQDILYLCNTAQSELSRNTGLCPVQKNCAVADEQADDVRYWIAASSRPALPLYAALPSNETCDFCAEFIKKMIH